MISVRSEVQVFPGPPLSSSDEHSSSGYGAIAQLGERVLCKHEVVGSIPSGSTTLRLSGFAWRSQAGAKRAPAKLEERRRAASSTRNQIIVRENITSQSTALTKSVDCVISDIVKRRSIRVGSCEQSRDPSLSPGHFRRSLSAVRQTASCKMILLAKLDRLAIGTILRSKLVFLISVRPQQSIHRGCALGISYPQQMCGIHSAECVDIDNESNQVP